MDLLYRLAAKGLVHCDFNEFNLMVSRSADEALTMIDFPQMVSVGHANARELFERDVECIIRCARRDAAARLLSRAWSSLALACAGL